MGGTWSLPRPRWVHLVRRQSSCPARAKPHVSHGLHYDERGVEGSGPMARDRLTEHTQPAPIPTAPRPGLHDPLPTRFAGSTHSAGHGQGQHSSPPASAPDGLARAAR